MLLPGLLSAQDDQDDSEADGDEGNDDDSGSGDRDFDSDPINTDQESDVKVEVNDEHPLGDYGNALFDYAHELVNDLAREEPMARDLAEEFNEAQLTRELYASWNSATTPTSYLRSSDEAANLYSGALMPGYIKAELAGMYLGLVPTSTTGGAHVPGSAHYRAGAVDFSVRNMSLARIEQTMFALRSAGIFVRDERGWPLRANGQPQQAWSAPHMHAQSVATDPATNGPIERWSEPTFRNDTFMQYPGDIRRR